MARWAAAVMDRTQIAMFSPTLDAMISDDHPVRLFDEILRRMDWSSWESRYVLVQGQPPIHPRVVASVLLYGLSQGIRSSRRLEWACLNAMDFVWLAEGRDIDHSSFCGFRVRFGSELKGLFRQIGRLAMGMGMVRLNQVALDGTKIKANNSRYGTAGVGTIEARLAELDAQIDKMFREAADSDQREDDFFGQSVSPNQLPRELADLKRRQERLSKALERARREQAQADAVNDKKEPSAQEGKQKKIRVPLADPDAPISPNKEGGFAPNYTPVATVDTASGIIVAADVLEGSDESQAPVRAVDQIREDFAQTPAAVLADSAFNSGPNLQALNDRQVEAYIPSATRRDSADNPARRDEPDKPVATEQWDKLPVDSSTKLLGRTAFVYDKQRDCYFCPMGKTLAFQRIVDKPRRNGMIEYRRYRCRDCGDCPLRARCLTKKADARTIDRDRHEELREAMDRRLYSQAGQEVYRRRAPWIEGTFGTIKSTGGLRQFLLRGLEKVRTEWRWACTAFNIRKIARAIAVARAIAAARMNSRASVVTA
jgi:transposase